MELHERRTVSLKVCDDYDDDGGRRGRTRAKTEDIYQSLEYPPVITGTKQPAIGECGEKKMMFLLLGLITVLLTITLSISAAHYTHFRGLLGVIRLQNTQTDVWQLHDNIFYLFWNYHGDCITANIFCARRNASLATVSEVNRAWLQSQMTNGKHVLVKASQSDNSGDFAAYMEEEDSECDLLGGSREFDEQQVEGWVCERAAFRMILKTALHSEHTKVETNN